MHSRLAQSTREALHKPHQVLGLRSGRGRQPHAEVQDRLAVPEQRRPVQVGGPAGLDERMAGPTWPM